MKQPILDKDNEEHVETFGKDLVERYGRQSESECLGIEYVEFVVPKSSGSSTTDSSTTAHAIAQFYKYGLEAATNVVQSGEDTIAIVGISPVDSTTGRPSQSLLFRESSSHDQALPPYDGHHIALYVGSKKEDFVEVFENMEQARVVWANPRFSDRALDVKGAQQWKQFRFKDILDLKTGRKIFTLEHDIRSVEHDSWPAK
jgi:hypothetical protein